MKIVEKCVNYKDSNIYINDIAKIHKNAYDGSHFTSHFSLPKLALYYGELIKHSDLSLLAINAEGQVLGFIIAGENVSKGVASFVGQNRPYLLKLMLKKPIFLMQKVKGILLSKLFTSRSSDVKFRLLSISVDSTNQSGGVGRFLIEKFEEKLKDKEHHSYGLSVRFVNIRAINFYIKNGFLLENVSNGTAYMVKGLNK